jgi:hypothetical protein
MDEVVGSALASGRALIAAFGHPSEADVYAALTDPTYQLPEKYRLTKFAWIRSVFVECVGDETVDDLVAETSAEVQADWHRFMRLMVPCSPRLHLVPA